MPLDFEIYGGQDEKSIDGNTGIFIKKIKEGSSLQRTVKIGDHILKVCEKIEIMHTTQLHMEIEIDFCRSFSSCIFLVLYITLPSSMNLKISWLKSPAFSRNNYN